ncbi:MAG: cysteine--tRNA ligase [Proteobacteria bacterium]|nr:cysteine--tRNA ligase [Pseudomonadota bacterium]
MPKPNLTLTLTNTLTRAKEAFTPHSANNVTLYVCGITPYDHAHIGHARAYVVFDILFRTLQRLYGDNAVKYARNFTDIDDKIITRAQEVGEQPTQLAQTFIASFHKDMAALNCLPPTAEPKVSDPKVLKGIVAHIDALIEKQFAYVTASGDVMYRTQKFPSFGALAHRKLDEQQHGARVKADDEKESPNDFVLWKANAKSATKLEQAFSPKDLGAKLFSAPGRPGWHIECSVMAKQELGTTIDIHGGGEDLQFPHHCCEIAQSEALLKPGQPLARFWLHNGFITVGGTKMSKSLGNFTTIKDALKSYSAEAIRLWLLQTHYRKPVDYTPAALAAAEASLAKLYATWNAAFKKDPKPAVTAWKGTCSRLNPFRRALADDLNTAAALAELHSASNFLAEALRNGDEQKQRYWRQRMGYMAHHLGLLQNPQAHTAKPQTPLSAAEQALLTAREAARASKNWPESDRLRDELKAQGILIEDGPTGTTWRRA